MSPDNLTHKNQIAIKKSLASQPDPIISFTCLPMFTFSSVLTFLSSPKLVVTVSNNVAVVNDCVCVLKGAGCYSNLNFKCDFVHLI